MTQETEPNYPQTIDKAVERLLDVLEPEDIENSRQMDEYDLISFHFKLGVVPYPACGG